MPSRKTPFEKVNKMIVPDLLSHIAIQIAGLLVLLLIAGVLSVWRPKVMVCLMLDLPCSGFEHDEPVVPPTDMSIPDSPTAVGEAGCEIGVDLRYLVNGIIEIRFDNCGGQHFTLVVPSK